jgi:hypothetical protein
MHHKNIKIEDSFNVATRGRVYVTNLLFDEHAKRFNVGDTFRTGEKILEIKSLEALLKTDGSTRRDYVAFLVKEISLKELLSKISTKDTSTMRAVRWRIRNRWWFRKWQRTQLWFLVTRDKVMSWFKK